LAAFEAIGSIVVSIETYVIASDFVICLDPVGIAVSSVNTPVVTASLRLSKEIV
jgi:hypothetical protein